MPFGTKKTQCDGKDKYLSQYVADNAAYLIGIKFSDGNLEGYKCSFCNGYHIGHRPSRETYAASLANQKHRP